jgi:hypothetical protein
MKIFVVVLSSPESVHDLCLVNFPSGFRASIYGFTMANVPAAALVSKQRKHFIGK